MEEYNLLYIDDDIDSQLSEYLDKDLKNALQSDIVLNISEHEFKPAEGYKSLLENPQVATANIILIDSRLFENNSATDGKFSGEEFKIILKKQFPFSKLAIGIPSTNQQIHTDRPPLNCRDLLQKTA